MICAMCGCEVGDVARYCAQCGTAIRRPSVATSPGAVLDSRFSRSLPPPIFEQLGQGVAAAATGLFASGCMTALSLVGPGVVSSSVFLADLAMSWLYALAMTVVFCSLITISSSARRWPRRRWYQTALFVFAWANGVVAFIVGIGPLTIAIRGAILALKLQGHS